MISNGLKLYLSLIVQQEINSNHTRMENKIKLAYESPEAELIQVRMEVGILQGSEPIKVNDYNPWEEVDI